MYYKERNDYIHLILSLSVCRTFRKRRSLSLVQVGYGPCSDDTRKSPVILLTFLLMYCCNLLGVLNRKFRSVITR